MYTEKSFGSNFYDLYERTRTIQDFTVDILNICSILSIILDTVIFDDTFYYLCGNFYYKSSIVATFSHKNSENYNRNINCTKSKEQNLGFTHKIKKKKN